MWFPDSTPSTVQRWTVPACRNCNRRLGALEVDLYLRLAPCTDPGKVEAAGLNKKVLKALGIGVTGLDPIESRARAALKTRIAKDIVPHDPSHVTLPGFGPHRGFPDVQLSAVVIPRPLINEVGKKIVRGCEYVLGSERIIESPYEITIYLPEAAEASQLRQALNAFSVVTLGPGFRLQRAPFADDPQAFLYDVHIWDKLKFFSTIMIPAE